VTYVGLKHKQIDILEALIMERFRLNLLLVFGFLLLFVAASIARGVNVIPVQIHPVNDNCSNAISVGNILNQAFDTTNATFDGPGYDNYIKSPNLWYCYTATCSGCATISLRGSSFDTKIAVYKGCDCYPERDKLIIRNDDFYGQQSQVTFPVVKNSQYLIEVGGFNPSVKGQGTMSISCDDQSTQPENDKCINAKHIGNTTELPFTTVCATFDGPGHYFTSPNLWYRYIAASTREVTVSLLGSEFDTALAVYKTGDCYPEREDVIDENDDFGGFLQSQITFEATAGTSYLFEVMGYDADEVGEGVLTVSSEGVEPPPPSKDNCQNAKPVGDVKNMAFTTADATFDGPGLCMTSPNIWYCYTATCSGNVTVSLAGSSFDTMLAVYDGCQCYPTADDLIECNDDADNSYQSAVTFAANIGDHYLLEIGGYGNEKGAGLLTISCEGVVVQNKPDLGDAPDSTNNAHVAMRAYAAQGSLPAVQANYPTVYNDGSGTGPFGPVHLNTQVVAYLGNKITRETEADSGTDEDGVNNIRPLNNTPDRDQGDDGVIFPINMPSCRLTTIDYIVNVVDPDVDLWVNVWLDFNRDGDWDDTVECPSGPVPEWAVQNQLLINLSPGINHITSQGFMAWHPENGRQEIWMRITLSGQPWRRGSNPGVKGNAGSGPQAKYAIGETEDYKFIPDVSISFCQDYNGDGAIDLDDLADIVDNWFEICP
jgi:hypothetical protein